jgi:formylmethanofuran dehydrogenase subunit E
MSNPMEEYFEELAAKVLEHTMCDNCHDEFPDDEMRYDPDVRGGAPVCKECYETLSN